MPDATQLTPIRTTPPYLIEHIANLADTDTLVNNELVAASWPSVDPADGDQIYVGQIADGNTWSGFLVANEHAARKARTAIARTYIAGLRAGAR
ncbi:hypothetical protein [Mycobacteroides abscessus]|uniref:hypothetical protein n=1 Tax=Mycobacteroides abscessus TaxID=36809 RepID=UPI000C26123E|nr:hypothetical protein [Mycobacteroides abscessus]RIS67591.1 hypothetical protein D2E70_16605 [Mycobacteroides abscessus]